MKTKRKQFLLPWPAFPADSTKCGYHILRIDGFSRTFNENGGVPGFESGPFRVGGHTWRIGYYPTATYFGNEDFISLYLFLADDQVVAGPVNVEFSFSILDLPYMEPLELPLHTRPDATEPTKATFSEPGSSCGFERFIAREEFMEDLLEPLEHDCFAIRVDLRIIEEEPPCTAVLVPPSSDMHHHLGDLLSRKEHTDVEFRVGEETFAAHRLLLGARSPVFKAELFGLNTTLAIQIDDMEARVFKAMLAFIYTDTWPEMESEEETAISQRLLVAADRYGLQRLKLMCEHRLCNLIDGNTVEDILHLAEKHQCAALKEACFDFIGSTAMLLLSRERLLQVRKTQELRFDRLFSLCPVIIKDQMSNVLEHGWSHESIKAIDITLDIE